MVDKYLRKIITVIVLALIFFATYIDFKNNYLISGFDTFFHVERVYEIRSAFKSGNLPGWLNFMTFHHVGQAINGMYPDISLWPLVYITNMFSPIRQIIIIKAIIMIATYCVTNLSIAKRFDKRNASYIAAIYVLSGMCLRIFNDELQLGTAIVLVFLFPIIFNTKELMFSKKIDITLILKLSLLYTVVIYSHLMSIFVIYLITGIFLIIRIVQHRGFFPLINVFLTSMVLFLTSLPVLFRYYTISKSGIQSAYSDGNVTAINFVDIFTAADWNSRGSLSIVSVILIFAVFTNLNYSKINKLMPYVYAEIVIIILGTKLAPWSILQNLPILSSIQNTGWRFLIFSGAIPLIITLINFNKRVSEKILGVLFLISICASVNVYWGFHQSAQKNMVYFNGNTNHLLGVEDWVKLQSSGINNKNILRDIVPDYAPKQINSEVINNGSTLSDNLQKKILNNQILVNDKEKSSKLSYTFDSVSFRLTNIKNVSTLELPVYGYRTLNYQITVDKKLQSYTISDLGFIQLHNIKKAKNVTIRYAYPKIYEFLVYLSAIILIILLVLLISRTRYLVKSS